jgi:hypothetical protein
VVVYCTIKEAKVSVKTRSESEANIITDTRSDMEDIVNLDNKKDFNPFGDNEDIININID